MSSPSSARATIARDSDRTSVIDELVTTDVLRPVLFANGCSLCLAPRWNGRHSCENCIDIRKRHGSTLSEVEFITFARTDDPLHRRIKGWKDSGCVLSRRQFGFPSQGVGVGAALSFYLEAHHDRLFGADSLVTTVPSRRPVVANAFAEACERGWSVPTLTTVADPKKLDRPQHTLSLAERKAMTPDEWEVDAATVLDKRVVVLDDVYTTGYTSHTFARALRAAGAIDVVGVFIERVVSGYVFDRLLEFARQEGPRVWAPTDAVVVPWPDVS